MIVQDNTEEILKELQQKQLAFVTAAAELVQSNAKALTPVDTGNLRSSIQRESYVEDGVAIGEVGPTANYSLYVELGSIRKNGRRVAAQPYMQPGYDKASRQFDRLKELLKL
jgi:HK97 gp10 family phage protein